MKKQQQKTVAVCDAETDPFLFGRVPKPFAWGFFDGQEYKEFWGDNSTEYFFNYLDSRDDPLIIYAHNGGKFDFMFFMERLENPIKVINGRIVKAKYGIHEFRDSFAIMPVSLQGITGGKLEFDYSKMEKNVRERNKSDILHYLAVDCEQLYKAVTRFINRFGIQLTIGGTAIKECSKLHPFFKTNKSHDEKFRQFYFGGRCEAIKTGILKDDWKIYDVNSMYPKVMRDYEHPTGMSYVELSDCKIDAQGKIKKFGDWPYFLIWKGKNIGAVPTRTKDGLDFTVKEGIFFSTHHEIKIALKHGRIRIDEVIAAYICQNTINFKGYVDMCIDGKIKAEKAGDKIERTFFKLLANSAYGKFGQNPENYFDWMIIKTHEELAELDMTEWNLFERMGEISIWQKQAKSEVFNDVATAASITGASRAMLLDALCTARHPIYCDTDSIICSHLDAEIDPMKLGAWKSEGEGDTAYIAGKKLYAVFSGGKCVKSANKGARLSPSDIVRITKGDTINWRNDAPSFRYGTAIEESKFVERKIRATKS